MRLFFLSMMTKIGYTTSRSPANKTRSFIHDIIAVVPNSQRVVRGSSNLSFCINSMKNKGFTTAIIVNSVKGNPNFMRIFNLSSSPKEIPFAVKIRGLTLSREYQGKKRSKKPSNSILISSLNSSKEEDVLRKILGISKEKIENIQRKEYVTAYADYIEKDEGMIFIEFLDKNNAQVGPRIKLRIIPRNVTESNQETIK